jgi:excisionase family DNA binding protein
MLTVDEAAALLLRTTRKAIYSLVERRQIPGVTRIGRGVLFRADDLLDWLGQTRAPSPGTATPLKESPIACSLLGWKT